MISVLTRLSSTVASPIARAGAIRQGAAASPAMCGRTLSGTATPTFDVPTGFHAKEMRDLSGGHLIVPDGWFHKRVHGKAYMESVIGDVISLEDYPGKGVYRTGVTFRIYRNVHEELEASPERYAEMCVQISKQSALKEVREHWDESAVAANIPGQPPLREMGMIVSEDAHIQGDVPITFYLSYRPDNHRGLLYETLFESPTDQWDETWKKGKVVVEHLRGVRYC